MAFKPNVDYQIIPESTDIKDFSEYQEDYVTRPPYQRKTVWGNAKKQSLLDSLVRGYYVPKVVLREVRLGADRVVSEVIDGQQRITTVQEFFRDEIALPKSLADVSSDLPGKRYSKLDVEKRKYIDKLKFGIDRITNIENAKDPEHQRLATEIFWRLQQGESLNQMEVAHARLSSLVRNFLVKYADDQTFDYEKYQPVENNPNKHSFFDILNRPNDRMQHLSLLARFMLIEIQGGAADLKDGEIIDLIEKSQQTNGIGDNSYEQESVAKAVLGCLRHFSRIFKNDPMVQDGGKVKELKPDYVVITYYSLLRHLRSNYVLDKEQDSLILEFMTSFHERWRNSDVTDHLMSEFTENRQHSLTEVRNREILIREYFFKWLGDKDQTLLSKDDKRAFSEAERISIYRRDKGLCQECISQGKPEAEALVRWSEYEADHVLPHSKGGRTTLENAQLLCRAHNREKSDKIKNE